MKALLLLLATLAGGQQITTTVKVDGVTHRYEGVYLRLLIGPQYEAMLIVKCRNKRAHICTFPVWNDTILADLMPAKVKLFWTVLVDDRNVTQMEEYEVVRFREK